MSTNAMTLESERPQCIGAEAQGRRCREPVVWDHTTDRPISTRCEAHGGLVDATVIGRFLGRLSALILAAALCLAMAGPALADFESAVAAYEDGAYREAQTEFEVLAAAGDERAQPYVERIREKLHGGRQSDESMTSTVMDSVTSIFGESGMSSDGSASGTLVTDAGPSTAVRSPEGASGGKPANWEPWSPFDQASEPTPLPVSDVAIPQRRSIWSTIFHLPGDATVTGLQYVAQSLGADNLSSELQSISRHSDKTRPQHSGRHLVAGDHQRRWSGSVSVLAVSRRRRPR